MHSLQAQRRLVFDYFHCIYSLNKSYFRIRIRGTWNALRIERERLRGIAGQPFSVCTRTGTDERLIVVENLCRESYGTAGNAT